MPKVGSEKEHGRIPFRSEEHLRSLLSGADFIVDAVFGWFYAEPVARGLGVFVFAARRA